MEYVLYQHRLTHTAVTYNPNISYLSSISGSHGSILRPKCVSAQSAARFPVKPRGYDEIS